MPAEDAKDERKRTDTMFIICPYQERERNMALQSRSGANVGIMPIMETLPCRSMIGP
jgi:hypothetical protein